MRVNQVCRIQILGFVLIVLMAIGFTIQILGIHFPKRSDHISPPQFVTSEPEAFSRTCKPKQHIMFLKTHKTAGSTILNLLHRYGDRNRLAFALPFKYQFNYPNTFQSLRVKGYNASSRPHYDIMCHHMRFNYPEVRKVMPSDSFYFTILRDPATMAESSFSYYRAVSSAFKKAQNFKAFINHPSHYYRQGERSNHYARNPLWFDLGFNSDAPFTEMYAKAGIRAVKDTFHLVLLAEHFDESMILLKEELCWDLDDVVTFKMNSRGTSRTLDHGDIEKLRAWNALDWNLYSYFNRTFWDKVEHFGKVKMDNEVRKLKERRQHLAKLCLEGSEPVVAEQIKEEAIKPFQFGQEKILGWAVRKDLPPEIRNRCVRMVTPELQYKDLLDARQFPVRASIGSVLAVTPARAVGR
ncbi:galactose-3-O-sulfotransferase 4 [Bufo bufo]|uniref:galactose-3-O-sulfotransferase 4 n=1 Tax=Bufo bufo TaxID=8384 RepID=UPI001ABDD608|nr:galactose-3-O-sulfotransferase 4 [Bufo bufo]XP_040271096.1 galactose-3-O-sulfotransferase 4 [Bufo bufo]